MTYIPLPIGIDDFKKLRENAYYYIDKTLFIKELLDKKGEVNLFTRPRRFGKTLNMSMLRYFFEIPMDGNSNLQLFHDLAIASTGEIYTTEQEQYPVILLTLKSAKQASFDLSYKKLCEALSAEFYRHDIVLSKLSNKERQRRYIALRDGTADYSEYLTALAFLSECLYEYYHKKVIILIDEYDVPLENAYYAGFYEQMSGFIRSLFESALKTNPCLEFSVITGCLRISRESIFTGLNNLNIISILSHDYSEYFGFTEAEVRTMLSCFHLDRHMDTMKTWYDGYRFGDTEVYNPWSVLNYVKDLRANSSAFPTAAWSNTSSNSIVKDLIYHATEEVKNEIELLISGSTLEKPVHEDITYEDIHKSEDNLWNFLLFTGYLKLSSMRMEGTSRYAAMKIPNHEILYIFENTITSWFHNEVKVQDLSALYAPMLGGQTDLFQQELTKQLSRSISYMDSKEAFYHGFLVGIMANLNGYLVKSNREAGNGRYDICIYSQDETIPPIILELKVSKNYRDMEADATKVLNQIEDKQYDAWLPDEGYTQSIRYGIAFYKKKCRIQMERREF